MATRVLISVRWFRIVVRFNADHYVYPILEKYDGKDALGVDRWKEVRDDSSADPKTLRDALNSLAVELHGRWWRRKTAQRLASDRKRALRRRRGAL